MSKRKPPTPEDWQAELAVYLLFIEDVEVRLKKLKQMAERRRRVLEMATKSYESA
jgi:hypothetical protein